MRKRRWATVVIVLGFIFGLLTILFFSPLLPSRGWSKAVVVSGDRMNMQMQLKLAPTPPVTGTVTLMARIIDEAGYTSRVNELFFTYSEVRRGFTQTTEGVPLGKFGTRGEGIYTASVEFPFPGDWQVQIQVSHGESSFNAAFPVVVKAQ